MVDLPFTTKGIVRTRDLVQLVRGARISTFTKYNQVGPTSTGFTQLVPLDPRRIRLELIIEEDSGAGTVLVTIAPLQGGAAPGGKAIQYSLTNNQTIIVIRDWTTDNDGVCEGLSVTENIAGGGASLISIRETILTPNAVDEHT